MSEMLDIDNRHDYIKSKLNILGFRQPLPIGALSLVAAILEDLIKTTDSFKNAKEELNQLREQKSAWDLGVEPYKCDNSRLLTENNALHFELIKQKDRFDLKDIEHLRNIRSLELDKKCLEEQCFELNKTLRDLQTKNSDPGCSKKSQKDGANMNKKPFISTVRSNLTFKKLDEMSEGNKVCTKAACNCQCQQKNNVQREICYLRNTLQNQTELFETLKKHLESREREIQRLNKLLCGGRPATALAKDCCFKGVGELAIDVEQLQLEKNQLQIKLQESITCQHESMQRAMDLAHRNEVLQHELKELEVVAVNLESGANLTIVDSEKRQACLESKLNKARNQIRDLQLELSRTKETSDNNYDTIQFQTKFLKATEDNSKLMEKLQAKDQNERRLEETVQKLSKKYSDLKMKLKLLEQEADANCRYMNEKSSADAKDYYSARKCEEELNRVLSERNHYQNEYLKLVEKQNASGSIEHIKQELANKESLIISLKSDLELIRSRSDGGLSNRSVQSAINRVERERDIAKAELKKLQYECETLCERLKLSAKTQKQEQQHHEELLQSLYEKIRHLENEKCQMSAKHIPTEAAINLLGGEIEKLKKRLQMKEAENCQLKTRCNQIRILQEQTERSLSEQQYKLMKRDAEVGDLELKLNSVDSNRAETEHRVGTLKGDISKLRSSHATLEREKDKLAIDLDSKTERTYRLEKELADLKKQKMELQLNFDELKRKYDDKSRDSLNNESSLREVANESHGLKQQIAALKISHDNVLCENRRLICELSNCTTDLTIMKRKLKEAQTEVDGLKQQLQQYVQEVQRVENLLMKKEDEREEMLEHYRSLSHDAVLLEGNNQSLEIEAAETKKQLNDADLKIGELEALLMERENDIRMYEKQINALSCQIAKVEVELESKIDENNIISADLAAVKELCDKLDLQKDKLVEELNEHSQIRQQLQFENEKLRCEFAAVSAHSNDNQGEATVVKEHLNSCRQEVKQYEMSTSSLNREILKLQRKVDELENKLVSERENSSRCQATADEYNVQLQELRHSLTNDRFEQARALETREESHGTSESIDWEECETYREEDFNSTKEKSLALIGEETSLPINDTLPSYLDASGDGNVLDYETMPVESNLSTIPEQDETEPTSDTNAKKRGSFSNDLSSSYNASHLPLPPPFQWPSIDLEASGEVETTTYVIMDRKKHNCRKIKTKN